jgi:hypothetical protein
MTHDRLRDLQTSFQRHVLHGDADMLAQVSADARPSAAARLAIYANAYRLRLLEALDTDFSALHTLAGDVLFEQIGRAYIDAYPSEHFSIRYFGQHLSSFLAQTAPYAETPVLAEMAALEWALTLAFDAADDPVLTETDLAALPAESWPGMRLHFHSSVQRPAFHWNVVELWTAIDQQSAPVAPVAYLQPRAWVIWRREMQTYFRPLDDTEAWAMDCLRSGADFATLCAGLCERIEPVQVGMQAASYLKGWVQAGFIAQLD